MQLILARHQRQQPPQGGCWPTPLLQPQGMRLGMQETAEQQQQADAQEAQAQHQRARAALPLKRQANAAWGALHQQNDGLQQQGQQLAEWGDHAGGGGETEDGDKVLSGFTAALGGVDIVSIPLTDVQRPFLPTAGLADWPTADSPTATTRRAASDNVIQWLRRHNVRESTSEELAVIFK